MVTRPRLALLGFVIAATIFNAWLAFQTVPPAVNPNAAITGGGALAQIAAAAATRQRDDAINAAWQRVVLVEVGILVAGGCLWLVLPRISR